MSISDSSPGGKPPRQDSTSLIIRNMQNRLDAIEKTMVRRADVSFKTGPVAVNEEIDFDFALGKTYGVLRVKTDIPTRLRIYTNTADRTKDKSRTIDNDPDANVGLVYELIQDDTMLDYHASPALIGVTLLRDEPEKVGIPRISPGLVQNLSTSDSAGISITLTIMQMEFL